MIRGFPEKKITDIEDGTIDLGGIEWTKCYTSDVHRAVKTAEQIFSGEIIKMRELREISMYPLFKKI